MSAAPDGMLKLWDIRTGRCSACFTAHVHRTNVVIGASFSPCQRPPPPSRHPDLPSSTHRLYFPPSPPPSVALRVAHSLWLHRRSAAAASGSCGRTIAAVDSEAAGNVAAAVCSKCGRSPAVALGRAGYRYIGVGSEDRAAYVMDVRRGGVAYRIAGTSAREHSLAAIYRSVVRVGFKKGACGCKRVRSRPRAWAALVAFWSSDRAAAVLERWRRAQRRRLGRLLLADPPAARHRVL